MRLQIINVKIMFKMSLFRYIKVVNWIKYYNIIMFYHYNKKYNI